MTISTTKTPPTIDDIHAAADRIGPFIHRTPVLTCKRLDHITGARLFLKTENLQKVGAFKARGATNAVMSLDDEAASKGVATHSSGNHAAALAWAASLRGVPAHVVMPRTAPQVKKDAVAGYGATITECEPNLDARESTLAGVVERTGATFIHPYDDPVIIAGAGTTALELLEDHPDLDAVIAPVGGGGQLSGVAIVGASAGVDVYGAEPLGADDAFRSIRDGVIHPSVDPKTICDGLLTSLSELTYTIIRDHTEGILTVTEEAVVEAMRLIWTRAKLVVEPSGAVPLAVVLEHGERFHERRLGLILSGGNVDLDHLPW
jgi:threonine dehydratase